MKTKCCVASICVNLVSVALLMCVALGQAGNGNGMRRPSLVPVPQATKVPIQHVPASTNKSTQKSSVSAKASLDRRLPDLVITDFWSEGHRLCYQVWNRGAGRAPKGHHTGLFINGVLAFRDPVLKGLAAGERLKSCMNYAWTCEGLSETLMVQANVDGVAAEGDKTNNTRQKIWRCDTTLPTIAGNLQVSASQTEATIRWGTDKQADSAVEYGQPAGVYPSMAADIRLVREHLITVSQLQPGTTYHYRIRSADAFGNVTYGEDRTFKTQPANDKEPPRLTLVQPDQYRGLAELTATATDNIGIEKVEFLLDDKTIFTSYSAPFKFTLDTRFFPDGEHRLKARAGDPAGNVTETVQLVHFLNPVDLSPPQVTIVSPAPGTTVGGKVLIQAHATDDRGVLDARLYVDSTYYENVAWSSAPSADITFQMDWDANKETEGSHHLMLMVYDTSFKTATAAIDLSVSHAPPPPEPDPPSLKVISRSVTRFDNYLDATILVKNTGGLPANNIDIIDLVPGFQPRSVTHLSLGTTIRGRWDPSAREGAVEILDSTPLLPGHQRNYGYHLVPVLAYPNPKAPEIGSYTSLNWDGPGGPMFNTEKQPAYKTTGGETILEAHAAAAKSANYLIITNPIRLIGLNCPAYYSEFGTAACWKSTNTVLSTMAELAMAKRGVLGYFHGNTAAELRDLIRTGFLFSVPGSPVTGVSAGGPGAWAQQLHISFNVPGGGWILIVGEHQIVPAWTISGTGVPTHDDGSDYIRQSDYRYADTTGDDQPQLIVGRIIGDTPDDLTRGLKASLGVHYNSGGYGNDMSHALAISGAGDFVDDFVDSVNYMAAQLAAKGTSVSVIHEKFSGADQAVSDYKTLVPGKDFIFLDDHGLPSSVGPLNIDNLPGTDFQGTNPVIWSEACLTGNYDYYSETNPAPPNGTLSERFFMLGAAGYFGSTEIGSVSVGKAAAKYVADHWSATLSAPFQFFVLKAWMASSLPWIPPKYRGFLYEFNYYGDPKLGRSSLGPPATTMIASQLSTLQPGSTGSLSAEASSETAGRTLEVTVPEVVFKKSRGFDHLQLAGGIPLAEDGLPDVSAYPISISYPVGTVVQNVRLVARNGLREGTGLNLEQVFDGRNGPWAVPPRASESGWYPEGTFVWRTSRNADGSTKLFILVYPFYYNSSTTEYRYYRTYQFAVETTRTTAALVGLSTDHPTYRSGQPVSVTAQIGNSGSARDVVLSVAIRELRRGQAIGGFPVRTLTGLAEYATLTQAWSTEGLAPGEYLLEAELREPEGTLLDRKLEHFRIGTQEAEVVEVTATPAIFKPGQSVNVRMTARNTGSLPVTGTAILRVIDSSGVIVAQFTQPVSGLQPFSVTQFEGRWNTADAVRGDYWAVGYLQFNSTATDPATAKVTTDRHP